MPPVGSWHRSLSVSAPLSTASRYGPWYWQRAAQRSQSMLIAQLLLCVGFLLFLIYPPISQILGF